MKNINEISFPIFFYLSLLRLYDIFPLYKHAKLPFPNSDISSKQLFFCLIHIDTWGPFHTRTYDRYRYFLLIVDNYSRGTWIFLLSTKSSAFQQNFLARVERQFDKKVKIIRSDNTT